MPTAGSRPVPGSRNDEESDTFTGPLHRVDYTPAGAGIAGCERRNIDVGTDAFASATRSRSGAKPSFTCCNMIVSCVWPEAGGTFHCLSVA